VADGQPVELDISFQYGIPRTSLVNIYEQHKTNFHHTLEFAAKGILRDVAANYKAEEFFSDRTAIEAEMRTMLEKEGDERGITINGFQVSIFHLCSSPLSYAMEQELPPRPPQ
jgi:regulator of protease activity HflC (stomatin/prohibitin superfamily)